MNRKIRLILTVFALSLVFAGCNLVEVNPERDAAIVVAKVGDKEITKSEFSEIVYMYYLYGYLDDQILSDPDQKKEYYKTILDILIDEKVKEIKAEELGCMVFTDEEKAELAQSLEDNLETYRSMYKSDLKAEEANADLKDEAIDSLVEKGFDEYLISRNISVEDISRTNEAAMAQNKLYEKITDIPEPTESDINSRYEQNKIQQIRGFSEGAIIFEQTANGNDNLYYVPENVRQAQHILIKIPDEITSAIEGLQENDSDAAAAKLEDALEELEEAANEAYARAVSNEETFEDLMNELGEDPGMDTKEYYIVMNPTQYFESAFAQALFDLDSIGDISEPISTGFGYHIIKYYGDMESGDTSYSDLHDEILDEIYTENKQTKFSENMEIWKESLKIKKYLNRLDD